MCHSVCGDYIFHRLSLGLLVSFRMKCVFCRKIFSIYFLHLFDYAYAVECKRSMDPQKDDEKKRVKKTCAIFRKQNICTFCHFHRVFVVVVVLFFFFFFAHVSIPQMLILIQTLISNLNTLQYRFVNINKEETESRASFYQSKTDLWIELNVRKRAATAQYWYFEIICRALGIFDFVSLLVTWLFFYKIHESA